ncbi:TonB-dependent hemoglobin/transferrin/lactoferrin family receptor [Rhodobacteraceae bacterium RKSG542]|uniref:TonB-dependent hemoglobin/transferrin/lactoferrin family receptor n=1 Tax=Pseudovibrio flavus TaxID=2529854 RepID=UPI0012BCAA6F|nr:TonB-dependent hemoglobin/transferrin/lactoferrin family receptor [Pseudovibrio flavus]MTI17117.1 TonB-dependent hemoglobin/transferrin/lactoferrin family receptor [Pseudovibrio flavus]
MGGRTVRLGMFRAGTALASLCLFSSAYAQEGITSLDTITVTASKGEGAAIEELASVSVVGEQAQEQTNANTVLELMRGVPGIAIAANSDDTGASVNLRGLEGQGRVAVNIDGARQNFQQSGHGLSSGSFYVEPEFLVDATIIKGPVANAYGSGAIGGVVSFRTKNPSDILHGDETWALESMLRYSTNNGWATGHTAAVRLNENVAALGSMTLRRNFNYKDGNGLEVADSGSDILRGMFKAEIDLNDEQRLVLGYIRNTDDFINHKESKYGSSTYKDTIVDNTLTANYEFTSLSSDLLDLRASAYWTNTDREQEYLQDPALAGQARTFEVNTIGFDLNNTSLLETGSFRHALTYGLDAYQDTVDTYDPKGVGSLYTPSGKLQVFGTFVQDTVEYSEWLQVIGGLRFDAYQLEGGTTENTGHRLSPKITLGVTPFEDTAFSGLQFYGTYAEGYRAPSITETLISGSHGPSAPFEFIPNPDLKAETAKNLEAGVNYAGEGLFKPEDQLRVKATVFRNDVKDFIDYEYLCLSGSCSSLPYDAVQNRNIRDARIEGVELEAAYDTGWMFAGVAGTIQKGYNETDGGYLESIPANKFVTTLGFRALEEKARFGVQWEAVAAQDDVASASDASDSYNVVNLFAAYEPKEGTTLSLHVDNLFDENYRPYRFQENSRGRTVMFTFKTRIGG